MENDETMIPDKDVSVFKTPKGINEDIVREISAIKGEPEWMLEYRLKALDCFLKKPMPTWGVDLSRVDFDEYTYYIRPSDKQTNKWEEVPETIKDTFDKLGIPEAEQKYLSGVTTQYESEVVYHNMLKEVQEKGVIFLDIDSGLREYPELFKKYFDTVIPYNDNKYDGKEITNDYEFTADKENMEVKIEFTFNGSTLGGKQLVTFEELYDMTNPEEPKKVTEHKDINDEGQTVTIKEVPETPTPETPGTTTKTSNPPKTGDTANAALWIAILVLSAAGITGVRIWNKKKQVKRLGIEEKKEEEE